MFDTKEPGWGLLVNRPGVVASGPAQNREAVDARSGRVEHSLDRLAGTSVLIHGQAVINKGQTIT